MSPKFFKVLYRSKKSQARVWVIHTDHGIIHTPAFVPVATKGTIKAIHPQFVKDIGVQVAFVNIYHLVAFPGIDLIRKTGGIHRFSKLPIPLMSDSGGFQVFSLAANKRKAKIRGGEEPLVLKISHAGVTFRSLYDGSIMEFTPEKSITYQVAICTDILMAFDECTFQPVTYEYAHKAVIRTEEWLKRSVVQFKNLTSSVLTKRFLYGIIQGASFKDLRKQSTEYVLDQPVDGIAIGGVAVGESKKKVREQVSFVSPYINGDRPVHLLGVGQFDDILDLVGFGIDSFDCVEPTRLARMGQLYQLGLGPRTKNLKLQNFEKIDILKNIYKDNLEPVDKNCQCFVCQNFTKAYLHHLFCQKEILAYVLANYHNLSITEKFFERIRQAIMNDRI